MYVTLVANTDLEWMLSASTLVATILSGNTTGGDASFGWSRLVVAEMDITLEVATELELDESSCF